MHTNVKDALKFSPYPIEVNFPDITKWKQSNTGIDYIHSFDSGVAGPHVMIMSLVHGNEVSGAIAVDRLLSRQTKPWIGRLTLGFANVAAYEKFDRENPDATRFIDEDLNRVWDRETLEGTRDSLELRRARQLRPLIDTVDFLLDIHSMHEASAPLLMCGPLEKGRLLAAEFSGTEHAIIDRGHANGKRLRDYGGFGTEESTKNALLIETGQHFAASSEHIALQFSIEFLQAFGLQPGVSRRLASEDTKPQKFIEITHPVVAKTMDFRFAHDFRGLEVIEKKGTVIAWDDAKEVVTPYDNCVIIQPSLRQLAPGVTVVRLGKIV